MVNNQSYNSENWGQYPAERARMLALLREWPCAVVVISGDRHFSEMAQECRQLPPLPTSHRRVCAAFVILFRCSEENVVFEATTSGIDHARALPQLQFDCNPFRYAAAHVTRVSVEIRKLSTSALRGLALPQPLCAILLLTHHCRVAPFVTHITAALLTMDWVARRAHLSMLSPRSSPSDVRAVPDVTASFPLGARAASNFDESLRQRCSLPGGRGLQLHVPSLCGANALASLVLCCCAAVAVVVWGGAAAARAFLHTRAASKWQRRPFKDKRENL